MIVLFFAVPYFVVGSIFGLISVQVLPDLIAAFLTGNVAFFAGMLGVFIDTLAKAYEREMKQEYQDGAD